MTKLIESAFLRFFFNVIPAKYKTHLPGFPSFLKSYSRIMANYPFKDSLSGAVVTLDRLFPSDSLQLRVEVCSDTLTSLYETALSKPRFNTYLKFLREIPPIRSLEDVGYVIVEMPSSWSQKPASLSDSASPIELQQIVNPHPFYSFCWKYGCNHLLETLHNFEATVLWDFHGVSVVKEFLNGGAKCSYFISDNFTDRDGMDLTG